MSMSLFTQSILRLGLVTMITEIGSVNRQPICRDLDTTETLNSCVD